MKTQLQIILIVLCLSGSLQAQNIPMDTASWAIRARAYVLENYKGMDAIYLQGGSMTLKNVEFLNGTIEYDIFLKKEQAFPGVFFRLREDGNSEEFYIRSHLSGKPDANQAGALIQNISPWQLLFGPKYSFPYDYRYDEWTHVKIVVSDDKAQVFLDWSDTPQLSWNTFTETKPGKIMLRGGNQSGMHIANVKISHEQPELIDFNPIDREHIEGLINTWEVSDMFEEKLLNDPTAVSSLISDRKWQGKIQVEEGTAANISRIQNLFDGSEGNTVLAKVVIDSDRDQLKLFEFGYSDRVVAILNGKPIYWGNNRWRSRDYRYLGTIGLFDGIYLDLKKGRNELIMAVSEDFGGWLITGRFQNPEGVKVR